MRLTEQQQADYRRDGYLVLRGVCCDDLPALRERSDALSVRDGVVRFGPGQKQVLSKVPQPAERDAAFRTAAQSTALSSAVQALLGPARIFRDVIVIKPSRDGVPVRYHQDIAFWDVTPAERVLSAWIALDDAPVESGCLEVIPASHEVLIEHGLVAGPISVPRRVSRLLRRTTSLTGTGDNPTTRRQRAFALAKNWLLGGLTRRIPALGDLVDLHIDGRRIDIERVIKVPIAAGDAILFDSRLIHGSGPNTSPRVRRAYIVSYMSETCSVPSREMSAFIPASSPAH